MNSSTERKHLRVSIIIPCHNAARWLAATLAQAQGWEPADPAGASAGGSAPGDVIGWCELRIGSGALTTDRPITRLHGAQQYIASFNLLGQGRFNQACGGIFVVIGALLPLRT